MLPFFQQVNKHQSKEAIISRGKTYGYKELVEASTQFAKGLLHGNADLKEARVAYIVNPGFDYVKVQWAIWQAGGIAVPLCLSHPLPALQYVIEDADCSIIVASNTFMPLLQTYAHEKGVRLLPAEAIDEFNEAQPLPDINPSRRAMILYTSGTTNKPKGVVTTFENIAAQITTLVDAWQWQSTDHVVCVLPLHHVHGIINVVCCSMWTGATCEFLDEFSAAGLFDLFRQGKVNVFMAVPTIYYKLIAYWEGLSAGEREAISAALKKFRLMVCGSAALPVTVMEKWKVISGHWLLERYGMTEIGMALSNPYEGERKPGHVGMPLPGVEVKLANENYETAGLNEPGEILVKGKNVFSEYWRRPAETAASFTGDGWFKTGDIAVLDDGYYRIMGRNSVDIIKSGGYKISALEIEEVLRTYPNVADCAVVGINDDEWGELVVAAIVTNDKALDTALLNTWLRERMAAYKTPRKYLLVNDLPRNAMGKVTKNDVKKLFI